MRLRLTSASGNLRTARLAAEPRTGGDLQIRYPDRRVVQQFKTRSGKRTWSLREVVDDVLPDLYRAVDLSTVLETRFEFVTDGRMGNWRPALEFFDSLRGHEPPKSPLRALDNSIRIRFFGRGKHTRRELFAQVCEAVRRRLPTKKEPLLLTRRKVWHLLGRFSFRANAGLGSRRTITSGHAAVVRF